MKTFLLFRPRKSEEIELLIYTVNGTDAKDAVDRLFNFLNQYRLEEHKFVRWEVEDYFVVRLIAKNGTYLRLDVLEVNTKTLGVDITVER